MSRTRPFPSAAEFDPPEVVLRPQRDVVSLVGDAVGETVAGRRQFFGDSLGVAVAPGVGRVVGPLAQQVGVGPPDVAGPTPDLPAQFRVDVLDVAVLAGGLDTAGHK